MGRHREGLTREYVIRFLVENKGAESTHNQIVESVSSAFKVLFKEDITVRSIDKALAELVRSGIVIKTSSHTLMDVTKVSPTFIKARLSTISFEYELDNHKISELIESEEIRLFKEMLESRKGKLDKDSERELKVYLMVRRSLEITRDTKLLKYEMRSTKPLSWAIGAFEEENETAKILKAFSTCKIQNRTPYLKYGESN